MATTLIHYEDAGHDNQGRRRFVLFWIGTDQGRFGTLAAQHFFARPEQYASTPLNVEPGETCTDAACRVLGCKRTERNR